MKREEILNMPAGIEIDVLIAKNLSLFVKFPKIGDYYLTEDGHHVGYVRPFSTDIAAAWEVVEKMSKFSITIESVPKGVLCRFFHAGPSTNNDYIGFAETAPLAICRAALLTVVPER